MDLKVMENNIRTRLVIHLFLKFLLILHIAVFIWFIIAYPKLYHFDLLILVSFVAVLYINQEVGKKKPIVYTWRSVRGKIEKIDTDLRTIRETIGGVPLIKPRFDHYTINLVICDLYLQTENNEVHNMHFEGIDKRQCQYYNVGDEVVRLAGTKFPVILNKKVQEVVCPVCGEFNDLKQKNCKMCGLKINN